MGNGKSEKQKEESFLLLSKIIHFPDCFLYKAMIQDR